jgi:hypothetical protein
MSQVLSVDIGLKAIRLDLYVAGTECGHWAQGNSAVSHAVVLSSLLTNEREISVLDLIRSYERATGDRLPKISSPLFFIRKWKYAVHEDYEFMR